MKTKILSIAIILILIGCSNKKEHSSQPTNEFTVENVVGIGKILPQGGIIDLAAPSSGIVKEVYFKAGDSVSAGNIILMLENSDEELSIKEVDSQLSSQKLAIKSSLLLLEQEKLAHKERQRLLNDAEQLLKVGATTGENVRTLQNEFNLGVEKLKKIENDYKIQQSQLSEMNIQRSSRINDLDKMIFRTPIDGILLDLTPKTGESVSIYQQYGRLSPNKPLIVKAEIDELFADRLKVGQICKINFPGDSAVAATGELVFISPDLKKKSLFSDSGTDLEDRRIREIEVSLNEIYKTLFIESKVECIIQLNK